jgi:hypothetical protein
MVSGALLPHSLVKLTRKRVFVFIPDRKMISNVGLGAGIARYPRLHLTASLCPRGLPLAKNKNEWSGSARRAHLLDERLIFVLLR